MAKRILVADDSVTIQKAFAMTFGSEGFTLAVARSADEGLALAQKSAPDLIIADGVMPGRTGYDFCAQVRSDPGLRGVPVYILTSAQQPYDEAKGQRAGADGHLLKPWDTAALLQQVGDVLQRGAGGSRPAAAPPARTTAASLPASAMEDDYGEISIDSGAEEAATPPPVVAPAAAAPRAPMAPPGAGAPMAPPAGMRPSLIPGMRPGIMPPARPGTIPARPLGAGPLGGPGAAPPRPAVPPVSRTMIGLPAANVPIPGAMRPMAPAPAAPLRSRVATPPPPAAPAPAPYRPRVATPPPVAPVAAPPPAPPPAAPMMGLVVPAVAASVDQKLAAISAKGPEYEAIAKLSREIIEQVVWEVVPELAEAILREHLAKRNV